MGWMIYEYRCNKCGIKFEAMVRKEKGLVVPLKDRPSNYKHPTNFKTAICIECGSSELTKLLSPTYGIVK